MANDFRSLIISAAVEPADAGSFGEWRTESDDLVVGMNIGAPIQLVRGGSLYDDGLAAAAEPVTPAGETLNGGAGADTLVGLAGDDTIFGGAGDDRIEGGDGANYLRGEDGDDLIFGGAGYDNVNGNKGGDTIDGGAGGGDWLLGGQGNDLIDAHSGANILNGNMGDDTVNGGVDGDILRGGQGNDLISGGAGHDLLFGDVGADTLTGGAGADIFHAVGWGGSETITDFNYAEGDRVHFSSDMFIYSIEQSGADVVVNLRGEGQNSLVFSMYAGDVVRLENVQLSSLPDDWIVEV